MPNTMRWVTTLALAAQVLGLTACGDEGPTSPEPPDITTLVFAPELGVDLSQMTLSPTGLYIRDLVEGEGRELGSQVGARFNFQGWLHDGTPVDEGTYPLPGQLPGPGGIILGFDGEVYYVVGSGQTIPAWDLGLKGMKVGGRRQLVVPPKLGFGGAGSIDGRVPPNAVLVYFLELLAIEP